MFPFLGLVAILIFVLAISKMGMEHAERIERIKRGYPLDGKIPAAPPAPMENPGYVDYTGRQQ